MTKFNFFATLTDINKQHAANLAAADTNTARDQLDLPTCYLPEPKSPEKGLYLPLRSLP